MYCIFGILTTIVSWLVYSLCTVAFQSNDSIYRVTITALTDVENVIYELEFHLYVLYANIVSWIVAVLVAFVTNKIWVFNSRSWRPKIASKEFGRFVGGRALTGIIEIIAVPVLVGLGLNQKLFGVVGLPAKIIVSVLIVILNYIISKYYSFSVAKKTAE